MRRAGASNSRCRSLRSAQCLRSQYSLSLTPFARTESNKYIRAALVYVSIVKSFAQAFSKACGFQRQAAFGGAGTALGMI